MAYRALDADKMLDIYIYDYLMKRKLTDSASIFLREAGVPASPIAIDTPGGFLFEWWSVFWDVFISRYKRLSPTKEDLRQVDLQNLVNQQQLQEQLRHNIPLQPSVVNQSHCSQKSGMLNALAKRKLEETRNQLVQKDAFMAAGKKSKYGEMVGQGLDLSRGLLLRPRSDTRVGQLMNDVVRATSMGIDHNQQLLMFPGLVGLMPNIKDTISDGSIHGANVTDPPVNDTPLKGWPLKEKSGFQVFQQVVQHFPLSIESGKLIELPIYRPQTGNQIGASGSGAHDDDTSSTSMDSYKARRMCETVGSGNYSNSLGTVKDIGLTSSGVYIMPSTQATEDTTITLLASPLDDSSSIAHVSGTSIVGPQSSEPNEVADLDEFVNNEPGADKAKFLMNSSISVSDNKDMNLEEVGAIPIGLVNLCGLSLNGKLIASCANEKKVVLWCTESKDQNCVMDEHDANITDICFGPRLSRIATSSQDWTVKIWNVNDPSKSLKTLKGHSAPVLSVDFHPKIDLVCSCDSVNAIRFWNARNGSCTGLFKGGSNMVRFQPSQGKYLAAAVQNVVSIIDVETVQSCRLPLQGHTTDVVSLCWNASGDKLVSLSENVVRVWKFGRGEEKNCIHELSISGKTFTCCVFHPVNPSLLVIGFNESLELWDMVENKLVSAVRQPVTTLAVSQQAGLVASAIDDGRGILKLWK